MKERVRLIPAGSIRTGMMLAAFALLAGCGSSRVREPPVDPDVVRAEISSPKIKRKLTTEWFATRVDARYERCLARRGART